MGHQCDLADDHLCGDTRILSRSCRHSDPVRTPRVHTNKTGHRQNTIRLRCADSGRLPLRLARLRLVFCHCLISPRSTRASVPNGLQCSSTDARGRGNGGRGPGRRGEEPSHGVSGARYVYVRPVYYAGDSLARARASASCPGSSWLAVACCLTVFRSQGEERKRRPRLSVDHILCLLRVPCAERRVDSSLPAAVTIPALLSVAAVTRAHRLVTMGMLAGSGFSLSAVLRRWGLCVSGRLLPVFLGVPFPRPPLLSLSTFLLPPASPPPLPPPSRPGASTPPVVLLPSLAVPFLVAPLLFAVPHSTYLHLWSRMCACIYDRAVLGRLCARAASAPCAAPRALTALMSSLTHPAVRDADRPSEASASGHIARYTRKAARRQGPSDAPAHLSARSRCVG